MPLIDLKTNLKSLKYGQDQPGGGNSGQPFIQTNINKPPSDIAKFDDGFVRGGTISAIKASATDTIRIGKFLTSLPKGPLWIVKQVGLQLSNPRLETRRGVAGLAGVLSGDFGSLTNGLLQPTRIYNLGINTIAQVPVNAFGIHFNRHGLLPVQDDTTKYLAVAQANNQETAFTGAGLPRRSNNRLVQKAIELLPQKQPTTGAFPNLLQTFLAKIPVIGGLFKPSQQMIDQYAAGPGSVYGIGRTYIRRYDYTSNGVNKQQPQEKGIVNYSGALGVSKNYFTSSLVENPLFEFNEALGYDEFSSTVTEQSELTFPTLNKTVIPYAQNIPAGANGTSNSPTLRKYQELREAIDKFTTGSVFSYNVAKSTDLSLGGSYSAVVNSYTNKNVSYNNGLVTINLNNNWNALNRETRVGSGAQDLINLTPVFENASRTIGDKVTIDGKERNINDLVKFRIQALKTTSNNTISGDWMVFRAYVTQFTDNVDASWNEVKYAGRGDRFYVYDGFTRKIQIGFKVAALSAQEMKPMYQKLNYLMGNLMPDYTEDLLMKGPLVRMTVGNWIDGQDGILNSLNYTVPQDSPWEIAINEPATGENILILPHIIEVNMTFTPIGSQTKGVNLISKKSYDTSHIAQNANEASTNQYITGSILQGI